MQCLYIENIFYLEGRGGVGRGWESSIDGCGTRVEGVVQITYYTWVYFCPYVHVLPYI